MHPDTYTRALLLLCCPCAAAAAPWQPVILPRAEQTHAVAANGREYRVQTLAIGTAPQEGYPVLYILDGDVYFAAAAQSARILLQPQDRPKARPLLLVGIGYRGAEGLELAKRAKDLTPAPPAGATAQEAAEFGGADGFAAFMDKELPALLSRRYGATDPKRQALFGHSYGGLFAAYALTRDSGRYSDYFLSSPSLWWQQRHVFGLLPADLSVRPRVLVSYGSGENARAGDNRRQSRAMPANAALWQQALGQRGLHAELVQYPGENHGSAAFAALHHSLKTLRDRWY